MTDIDIVILWVDGNDPAWQKERARFAAEGDIRSVRYRDWGLLRYFFRGVETYAPWVGKVHLVTWGHLPAWLDTDAEKLRIVRHEEFIDPSYLPLFNANPLEISLHRIPGLTERFVYFNDDFFLAAPVSPERFFRYGRPKDALISNAISTGEGVGHFVLNALDILNDHFAKYATLKKSPGRFFHPAYGVEGNLRNLLLLPWSRFTGFFDPHQPQPFLKSTFEELWKVEGKRLQKTMTSRFRNCGDFSQYLFRYWQLAKGEFEPVSFSDTKYLTLTPRCIDSGEVEEALLSGKYGMVCLNDSDTIADGEPFERAKDRVKRAFEKLLPKPSSFEVDR
ncbi:Stealth CR1 domain-containing protein [Hydrogenimonas cancrithermarum]|uniref:Exopolysaccharide phosphotransferase cps2G n=1 Tax=Hydrogenimonas cancrithermarum TaxID=2993563 RepID=A0ABN6WY92_9BACT|nr:Stealth CR1 domain-containing protein [Hydrogenimonas cancrithermarum]BDY13170.1 exopolysaccharide phosphotransferase cps2G [Hydrogenimonas cancrithermarum]